MLELPDVTLVCIESLEHDLASLAIKDCIDKVRFADVLIFTDRFEAFEDIEGARFISVPNWPTKIGWSKCLWNDVASYIATSHLLSIQWDSFVNDPSQWTDEFLEYDYIGAPWPWHTTRRVGNGGFSLRSSRLMRYVREHRKTFPCTTDVDDDLLCRKYRQQLEELGFVWAPERLAWQFAFEIDPPPDVKSFGFHAAGNFVKVLDQDRLAERAKLMAASPYITKSYIWKNFRNAVPQLVEEMENGKSLAEA